MHSIRVRITALAAAIILISMLSVLAACYFTFQASNDRQSVETMNLIGQNTQKSLEKYIAGIEQSVEMAANLASDSLDAIMLVENGAAGADADPARRTPEQEERADAYLAEYCDRAQDAFASMASHTQGVVTYYYCLTPEISRNVHGFFYSRVGKTGFEEQPPLDARELDPEDIEHTTWYYTTIRRGRPSWIGPYTAHFLGEMWTYSYLVPIYKAGTLIGVLGMDIPFSVLTEQISPIRVCDTGYACLIDEENRIMYHPSLPMGSLPDGYGISGLEEMLRQENNGDRLIRYQADGEERQMSFTTLSNGMKLIITAPTKEINASGIRLTRTVLLVTAALIIVSSLLILFAMRFLTQPLKRLTDASQQLADGDFNAPLNYSGRDEIGKLTEAFTRMRDRQKDYIADLNRQIYTDKLTGLPNMRGFFRLAREEHRRVLDEGGQPAMLYFNLTGLKHFNRQYGFEEGDRLICSFANILQKHYGDDRLCRYSEDHFAAVTDERTAEAELQAVFSDVAAINGGKTLPVRVGIYPDRIERVDVSVACDRARYAGDQLEGMNESGFRYFDEDMLREGEDYRYIYANLDRALEEGWIKVYYQAIIRAADGKICDEEALSRWIDPERGFLSPAEFIPALEEAKLIYKLDLYVVEQVLQKMKRQAEAGLYVVPQSVNLSRMDFDSCDIVEEIRRRVDEAGIDRSMLTIEITESVIGSDFEFMKEQVARFRELGFQVWMDDFGSGYSSLDVLQSIQFDVIKFDMRFMQRFSEGDEGKIILTELTRMAISLGVETVCEGVELEEQVEFLREIGCTRIQGFYYGRPVSVEEVLSRGEKGAIEFENPEEAEYYSAIGRINLYDLAALSSENDESLRRYFNTLPVSIIEVNGPRMKYNRCNKSYRDFLKRAFNMDYGTAVFDNTERPEGPGSVFKNAVIRCGRDGGRTVIDERVGEDTTVHTFIRRIAVNPVTGTSAVAVAVLAAIRDNEDAAMNYAQIAKAMSSDYVYLYYVNMSSETFIEYSPDPVHEDLTTERRGEDFFAASRRDALEFLYREDQEDFIAAFNRENIEQTLDTRGTFTLSYRLLINGTPTYVNMKAVRMQGDRDHIIIGVSNVDAQMRQKEAMARIQAERITYSRINALMQDCICIYTVDPATGSYLEYTATGDYSALGLLKEGGDFFASCRQDIERLVYEEDIAKVQTLTNRENLLEEIEKNGQYTVQYRLMLGGEPKYVSAKAVLVEEQDGPQLIIGINNVDDQVRREQEYQRKLFAARSRANLDTLTGVKNRTAYDTMTDSLNHQVEAGQTVRYAIALCRVCDLGEVNETQGRDAGDQLIRNACAMICETFKHSPVFRVTGDQFAVIAQGHDYEYADDLVKELEQRSGENGGIEIACGMAKYEGTGSVASVFERADTLCRRQG